MTNHGTAQPKRTGARSYSMTDKKIQDKESTSNDTRDTDDLPLEKIIENALWDVNPNYGKTLYKKVKDKFKEILNLTTGGA